MVINKKLSKMVVFLSLHKICNKLKTLQEIAHRKTNNELRGYFSIASKLTTLKKCQKYQSSGFVETYAYMTMQDYITP